MTKKKSKKITDEKLEEIMAMMDRRGQATGLMLAKLADELHPDAMYTIPLYRSCLVIFPPMHGQCLITAYHDPAWLGHERNLEELPKFREDYIFSGQRSGPDVYRVTARDGGESNEWREGEIVTSGEHGNMQEWERFHKKLEAWWYQPYLWIFHRNPIANKIQIWLVRRQSKKLLREHEKGRK